MGLNNPLPSSLRSECKKAGRIIASFVDPKQAFGPDKIIPPSVLANAKGLAIITVLKGGFLFSGRIGSGLLIARLPDGSWSAPSCIGLAGAGFGGQIGLELTDFVMILNTRDAVKTFAALGSVTLGGNLSVAAGPIGRNAEVSGSASHRGVSAVFSYSKTKGLFAGVSLEGTVLVERRDANKKFYKQSCTAKHILNGSIPPPPGVEPLHRILESRVFKGVGFEHNNASMYNDIPVYGDEDDSIWEGRSGPGLGEGERVNRSKSMSSSGKHGSKKTSGIADDYDDDVDDMNDKFGSTKLGSQSSGKLKPQGTGFRSTYTDNPHHSSTAPARPTSEKPKFATQRTGGDAFDDAFDDAYDDAPARRGASLPEPTVRRGNSIGPNQAIALYTFEADQTGDLGFKKGDIVTVVQKSVSQDDWWTGELNGKSGIFPANYVQL